MDYRQFEYQPLRPEQIQQKWNQHKKIIESFLIDNNYEEATILVNEEAILAAIAKVHQRQDYYKYFHSINMSMLKETALTAFWYIKLHPLFLSSGSEDTALNEKLAVYLIVVSIKKQLKENGISFEMINSIPENYWAELVYSFKYRDISKEALILIVETLASCLGLDPNATE